jgi:hypothetical protein
MAAVPALCNQRLKRTLSSAGHALGIFIVCKAVQLQDHAAWQRHMWHFSDHLSQQQHGHTAGASLTSSALSIVATACHPTVNRSIIALLLHHMVSWQRSGNTTISLPFLPSLLLQDSASFLHVNYYWTPQASWKSVGLLLASTLQDARSTNSAAALTSSTNSSNSSSATSALAGPPPKYGYILSASNATFVPLFQQLGGVDTPVQSLLYVDGNVTLSKPPVPQVGMLLQRPMAVVGLSSTLTGLDLAMQRNSIIMSFQ